MSIQRRGNLPRETSYNSVHSSMSEKNLDFVDVYPIVNRIARNVAVELSLVLHHEDHFVRIDEQYLGISSSDTTLSKRRKIAMSRSIRTEFVLIE